MDKELFVTNKDMENSKYNEISGADFCKYYQRPPQSNYKMNDIITDPEELNSFSVCPSFKNETDCIDSKSTQTDYRESESQTDPWDPPFVVHKVFKEPEVLFLKNFVYGRGLPASILEVNYIAKARELEKKKIEAFSSESEFAEKKKVIYEQVKNDWDYRVAVINKRQQEKLGLLQSNIAEDLKRRSIKKEKILKNLFENKKEEMRRKDFELEQELTKKLNALESNFPNQVHGHSQKGFSLKRKDKEDLTGGIDYMLSNYLSHPEGISTVKKWIEAEVNSSLTCDILSRTNKRVQKDKLGEKGHKNIFEKKKTTLPPEVYHEDYEKEETPLPPPKTEAVLEVVNVDEKKIDLVTVWQRVLRGLACQKQMLQLIERHNEGLSTILEPLYPGISDT